MISPLNVYQCDLLKDGLKHNKASNISQINGLAHFQLNIKFHHSCKYRKCLSCLYSLLDFSSFSYLVLLY